MKILKKKAFWIVLILIIVVAAVVVIQSKKPKQEEVVTAQVQRGNIIQTVSATGKVESASETDLNFSVSGKLLRLYVKAGYYVKGGQLLAHLESSQAASRVAQAQAQFAEAQADLDKVKAGASDEDIGVSEKSVASVQATLEAAQVSLTNAITTRDQGIISLKDDLLDSITDAIFNSKKALNTIEDILDSDYDDYLGNVNRNTYYQTYNQYPLTSTLLTSLKKSSGQYSVESSQEELISLANQTLIVLRSVDDILDDCYNMLIKSRPIGSLTQSTINSYKSNIETEQASIATKISAVQSTKSDLESSSLSYRASIDNAKAQVVKAEKELALTEAQLSLKKASPRDFELAYFEAKLLSAQANLQSAQADLAEYSLRAPIDGLITKVHYEIGEFVNSARPLISMISESNLEIRVDVPESDIAKIKVGDEVKITLDAFSDEQVFAGHLTFINPAETIINDVVYYQVKATFDQKEEEVKSGMTANVIVLTASREDALYISARAVIEKNGQRIVRVLVNGQKQEKEVTTGLRADEGMIEIISGLTEGETVITYIKNGK